jgi:transposase-like protein
MDFREIGKLVSEDRISLEYLWKKRGNEDCPSCSCSEFYFHQRWRVRCKECKKNYWPLQGTRFALLRILPLQWLSLIKLFELSVSARKASQEVPTSYKTALMAYDVLRRAIEDLALNDDVLKGDLEAYEAYSRGRRKENRRRGACGKTIVFWILERGGKVSVSIIRMSLQRAS